MANNNQDRIDLLRKVYSKSDIMELYLNSVFFGHQANGIQAASLFYFGKEVKNLNLNESASMIGLLPSPIWSIFLQVSFNGILEDLHSKSFQKSLKSSGNKGSLIILNL